MKTTQVFLGADLRCCHAGLIAIAVKHGCDPGEMAQGEAYLFINSAKDRLKALSWNGVMSYVNFKTTNRKIDLDALEFIPQAITPQGHMVYAKALRLSIKEKLGAKRFTALEMI